MFALQKLAMDISNIRLFQSYRGIKHVDVLYKEWTQIENNCQKKLIAHVLWSLPYTSCRTYTGPILSSLICCWTKPQDTSNKPIRVLVFLFSFYLDFAWNKLL